MQATVRTAALATDHRLPTPQCDKKTNPATPARLMGVPELRIAPRGSVTVFPHMSPIEPGGADGENNWCTFQPNQVDAAVKPPTAIQHAVFH